MSSYGNELSFCLILYSVCFLGKTKIYLQLFLYILSNLSMRIRPKKTLKFTKIAKKTWTYELANKILNFC